MHEADNPVNTLRYGSPAYKKAYRNYQRSVRNQPVKDEASPLTPFRSAEKRFKAKFPPPDLSNVLDLALLEPERGDEVNSGGWKGRADAIEIQEVRLVATNPSVRLRKAYCIPKIPGLVLLPGYLSSETQKELIRWSLYEHARWPNETNLDIHFQIPTEGLWAAHIRSLGCSLDEIESLILPKEPIPGSVSEPMGPRKLISNEPASPQSISELASQPKPPPAPSESAEPATATDLLPKLRWANIGWFYHWGTKHYDFSRGKVEIKEPVRSLCKEIVRSIEWSDVFAFGSSSEAEGQWGEGGPTWNCWHSDYEPDAGIVNFYQLKDTLMAHVDRSEVCATSPLVSISLGNAAVFLIGGQTRDVEPIPIILRSGDAVVMAGPNCRRVYHGIPRILEGTLPPQLNDLNCSGEEWSAYQRYLQTTRINVNVRQVFPKGFDPAVAKGANAI